MAVGRTNAGSQAKQEIYGVVNMVNVTYHPTSKLYVEEPPAGKVFKDIELQKDIYLIPSNIKKGIKIEGVTGTYEGSGSTINTVTMTNNAVGSNVTAYFNYLNNGDVLVLNDTKVMPARIIGVKSDTGAVIEVLLLKNINGDRWECLVKPAKRVKIGTIITFGNGELKCECVALGEDGNRKMLNGIWDYYANKR